MRVKSKNIKIGDILEIDEKNRTPADIVLLSYNSTKNYCFIDTSNLDGEKTLKPKISVLESNISESEIVQLKDIQLEYWENDENLSNFKGNIKIKREKNRLDINNFIPRSAMIRNTTKIYGLVVYVGENTKLILNLQRRIFKKSTLDKKLNKYIIYIMIVLVPLLIILSIIAII